MSSRRLITRLCCRHVYYHELPLRHTLRHVTRSRHVYRYCRRANATTRHDSHPHIFDAKMSNYSLQELIPLRELRPLRRHWFSDRRRCR